MLLGPELHVHTNQKNILTIGDSSQQRLQWISYVDEYGLTLHYVEVMMNVIADTLSRLSCKDDSPDSTMVGKNDAIDRMTMGKQIPLTITSHGLTIEKC